ncbi:hypothetical protein APE_1193.1 [Aeropyrum pernix K1]|uniref:Uncharacterized protein n=1 Tax=Aeropyrum pernix (strain ATCC 700893 / DSM 11879 / JCM 9820 / NBRC 100138 / K1) TaxID=272557 RepID=Q9YCR8_AERPE|nr:hypothetical protein [Aeropyrum pernix]BAA80179.2 hypothetical protein APE_1193.1 [Aeropyrum pernix K1]
MERSPGGVTTTRGSNDSIRSLALQLLKPDKITPKTALRAIRRAKRNGAFWRALKPLQRSILEAAARAKVKKYTAEKLRNILAEIIAQLELYTLRGTLILLGLSRLLALKNITSLALLKSKISYVLYLGRRILETVDYFKPWAS